VPSEQLRSYQKQLAQYHLHPEAKFHNGDYLDCGVTRRRHIRATAVEHLGKEANRWEEQFFLGLDLETQTQYGTAPGDHERIFEILLRVGQNFGQHRLATSTHWHVEPIVARENAPIRPAAERYGGTTLFRGAGAPSSRVAA
jgi:hypothetical protein